jgi:hypothetical protein
VPLLLADLKKWRGRVHTGCVDQDVHLAEALQGSVQRFLNVGLFGGIALHPDGLAALFHDGVGARIGIGLGAARNGNFGAGLRQAIGHRPGQHAAAANHHGDFTYERKESAIAHLLNGNSRHRP